MDLQTAAKRYEEARHFWAREIALKLMTGTYRSGLIILRYLAAQAEPQPLYRLAEVTGLQYANQHSGETAASALSRRLMKGGLVGRTMRGRAYWYALSELGELVLEYIPENHHGTPTENITENMSENQHGIRQKKRGRPRKIPSIES